MDIGYLKSVILEKDITKDILENIGCHHIQFHSGNPDDFYTCANKDGDNTSAITVYLNSGLKTINYTRNLNQTKESHDLIDLVMYNKKINFFMALNFLCNMAGLDYYGMENDDEVPESIKLIRLINSMCKENEYIEDVKLIPKNKRILSYYQNVVNDQFKKDHISYHTQRLFEVGYDPISNRITIPIHDEIGNLVGVKGRIPEKETNEEKYIYLIRCPRGKILYNYFRAYKSIQEKGFVIVVESEKAVMQLYDMGIKNVVALSGSKLTAAQRQKLINLHVDIVFALDKDISIEKIKNMAGQFPLGFSLYAIVDSDNILDEKESPTDDPDKWNELYNYYLEVV